MSWIEMSLYNALHTTAKLVVFAIIAFIGFCRIVYEAAEYYVYRK